MILMTCIVYETTLVMLEKKIRSDCPFSYLRQVNTQNFIHFQGVPEKI